MDGSSIFSKTGKGMLEASGKSSVLARADRAVLAKIDGKTRAAEINKSFEKIDEAKFLALLRQLEKDGFVREVASSAVPPVSAPPKPVAPPPAAKPAGAAAGEDLDFTQALVMPTKAAAPAAPKRPVDLAAQVRAASAQDSSPDYKTRDEVQAKAAALAAQRANAEAEVRAKAAAAAQAKSRADEEAKVQAASQARARAEAEAKAAVKAKAEADAKAKAKADSTAQAEHAKKEAEEKAARDAAETARLEAEIKAEYEKERAKAEAEADRLAREQAARRQAEEKAQREAEERVRAEAELKAQLEREHVKAEAERKAREEAERVARDAEERARKEAEEKARREAEEKARREAEDRARVEAERKAKEEAERKAREEAERKAKEEVERKAREEAERKAKEEAERKAKEEAERKAKEEAERKAKEEAERKAKEEAEQKAREEAERKAKEEAEHKAKEEIDRLAAVSAAALAAAAITPAAPTAASATDSLLADLDSFSMRDDEERERREAEEKARKAAEQETRLQAEAAAKREAEEQKRREEEETRRKDEAARLAREEEERTARAEEERRKQEEEGRARKAKESPARHVGGAQPASSVATPSVAAKAAEEFDDDLDISDADLGLDDIKEDEKKLAKDKSSDKRAKQQIDSAARKARKAAVDPDITVIPDPVRVRRPIKWGKPAAIFLFVLVLGGLGFLHVIPLSNVRYEELASEALGRPVKIGSVHLSVITGVELRFENVSVGAGVRAATVRAVPQIGTLFADEKVFTHVAAEGLVVPQAELGAGLFGAVKGGGLSIARVTAAKVKFPGAVPLPDLDLDVAIGPDGAVQSVGVKEAEGKLAGRLLPKDGSAAIELNAASLQVPFIPALALSNFSMKGTATPQELAISAWSGKIFDGTLSGTARVQWGPRWSVDGDLRVRQLNVSVLAPALMSEGRADARGTFSMSGAAPDKLGAEARIDGSFTVIKGVLGSFSLSRALQSTIAQVTGRTEFTELTGVGLYNKGVVQLRDMKLAAGLLSGNGTAEIDAAGRLTGRVNAELGTQRATFALSGTSKEPLIRK